MASPTEKRHRRSWQNLQDRIESLSPAECRAVIDSLAVPGSQVLWTAIVRVLRDQMSTASQRAREDRTEIEARCDDADMFDEN